MTIKRNNFIGVIDTIIHFEGVYSNDPLDPGGETKYGISKRSYPDLDIKNLTIEQAAMIYEVDFWGKYRIDEVINQPIAEKMMVLLINMPPKNWGLICQRALRAVKNRVVEDGIVGSKTITAINNTNPALYLIALRSEAAGYYRSLNKKRFVKGWLNRAYA